MRHYSQDGIKSMARLLDHSMQVEAERSPEEGEQPTVFDQNEVDTCDLLDGGPWFGQYDPVKKENTSDCRA